MRALLLRLRSDLHGPAWPLATFLLAAFALRLPGVWFAHGYEYVDQQFQYVDPAWHLASGEQWTPTWEWADGMRSWVYPGFLASVFTALRQLGLDEPFATMRAVRAVHAVLSLLPMWLFWLLVVRWRPLPAPRPALALVAASGLVVSVSVQPSGPTFAAMLALAAAIAVHGPRAFALLGGLCLGFAYCCRFQDALFGPPLFAVLLWQRRRAAAVFAAGTLPGIALQCTLDFVQTGSWWSTPWSYFEANVLQGAANAWSSQPWWFYVVAGVLPVVVFVPPFLGAAWRTLRAGANVLPAAFAAAVFHLTLHSFIARKALRFEASALAILLVVLAAGMAALPAAGRLDVWHRRAVAAVHLLLAAWASLWFGHAGAVHTSLLLRELQPQAVLVVEGDATSLGGLYYGGPASSAAQGVQREAFAARLASGAVPDGTIVVAVREPLSAADLGGHGRLDPLGAFDGCLDWRRRDRRFVYRWRA